MLKDILIISATIINRNDIVDSLKKASTVENITNEQIKNDVFRLISYYNFVSKTIFHDYFDMVYKDVLKSDENNKIYYFNFSHEPIKIISVSDSNNNHFCANVFTTYLLTKNASTTYHITYKYLPSDVHELNDNLNLPSSVNKKILCYGIASEYFASKNLFNESDFWKNRYMFEIFKLKTKKERRLKSTFSLWNKI